MAASRSPTHESQRALPLADRLHLGHGQGRSRGGGRLHEEALLNLREAGYVWGIFTCLTNVGLIRLALGETERAGERFREILPLSRGVDDKIARHHAVFGLACVAAENGDLPRAARLWGATKVMQESSGVHLPPITLSSPNTSGAWRRPVSASERATSGKRGPKAGL